MNRTGDRHLIHWRACQLHHTIGEGVQTSGWRTASYGQLFVSVEPQRLKGRKHTNTVTLAFAGGRSTKALSATLLSEGLTLMACQIRKHTDAHNPWNASAYRFGLSRFHTHREILSEMRQCMTSWSDRRRRH